MFNKKFLKRTALIGVIWFVVTFATGLLYAGFNWSLYLRVCKTAGLWYINVIIIGIGISYVVSKISFDRFSKLVFYSFHLIAALVCATVWTYLAFLDLKINPDPDIKRYLNRMYGQYFNIGIFVYAALAGWLYSLRYHKKSIEQAVREADLQRLAREAELKALKAQINPHFLFNALNSVNALVVQAPQAAREMNTRLANILRYALDGFEKEFVTLQQELDFVNDYLEIEKIRLEENLKVQINLDEELMHILIPPMTLEPLVENAIKHGIAKREGGGTLTISIEKRGSNLCCQVTDTGSGFSSNDSRIILKHGMGLQNTLERLKRIYENNFKFGIQNNVPSGCTVTLSFPITERRA